MSDTLEVQLNGMGLDARERKFLWPDAVHWIQALYVPEGYSESQMNELEELTAQWAEDVNPEKN